jgi:protein-S-isoprenylcysteine O-methyltransferase Ste14
MLKTQIAWFFGLFVLAVLVCFVFVAPSVKLLLPYMLTGTLLASVILGFVLCFIGAGQYLVHKFMRLSSFFDIEVKSNGCSTFLSAGGWLCISVASYVALIIIGVLARGRF